MLAELAMTGKQNWTASRAAARDAAECGREPNRPLVER